MEAHQQKVLHILRQQQEPLFTILDAARDQGVLELLRQSRVEYQSLYEGAQALVLSEVAPYLVSLSGDFDVLPQLVSTGWGKSWGVFLTSSLPFKTLRRHLRRFLMVDEEQTGGRLYFRFYDPRVLRTFLPTCSPHQKEEFFGEISSFLLESSSGELSRYERPRGPGQGR